MQVIAMGRWSKSEKEWKTVVAMRRAASAAKGANAPRSEREPRERDE
jgi:hypothetical protein